MTGKNCLIKSYSKKSVLIRKIRKIRDSKKLTEAP